jgi:hypothetical protein
VRKGEGWGLALFGGATLFLVLIGAARTYNFPASLFPAPPSVAVCDAACAADLAAQQHMALAAWAMVSISVLAFGLSVATIYFIRENLREARAVSREAGRSARAAEEAVVAAREIGVAQVRAYLAITNILLLPGDALTEIKVTYANSGQSPSKEIKVSAEVYVETSAKITDPYQRLAGVGSVPSRRVPALPVGGVATATLFSRQVFGDAAMEQLIEGGNVRVHVQGTIRYKDVFGAEHAEAFHYIKGFYTPIQEHPAEGYELRVAPS